MPRMPKAMHSAPMIDEIIGKMLGNECKLGAPVTAVVLAGKRFAVTTGDGRIAIARESFETADVIETGAGAILSAIATETGVLAGTDDGRAVMAIADRDLEIVWRDSRSRWVDCVAAGRGGATAWSCGKSVHVSRRGAPDLVLDHPSTVGGIAFAPKGRRLAASHYGGVTIWDISITPPAKRTLEWKGMHLDLSWSPDERFIVTAMQESALHGWRLSDKADFQMNAYPSKPRSLSWSRRGDWLATSGASEILLWSFKGKNGPMGTSALALSQRSSRVTQVAFHPLNSYVAAGFRDGAIVLARQEDIKELLVRRAKGGAVASLAWSRDGRRLAYGTEDGAAGIVDFSPLEERTSKVTK
jgi:WD40 repeat protein